MKTRNEEEVHFEVGQIWQDMVDPAIMLVVRVRDFDVRVLLLSADKSKHWGTRWKAKVFFLLKDDPCLWNADLKLVHP